MRYTNSFNADPNQAINWDELKKALHAGATAYINDLSVRSRKGWFHGETGLLRAQRLQVLTDQKKSPTNDELFILLRAIFQSSASGLQDAIAQKIIGGDYTLWVTAGADNCATNTLTSLIFTDNFIKKTANNSVCCDSSPTDETGGYIDYNKTKAMTWIVNEFTKLIPQSEQENFYKTVKTQLISLEKPIDNNSRFSNFFSRLMPPKRTAHNDEPVAGTELTSGQTPH